MRTLLIPVCLMLVTLTACQTMPYDGAHSRAKPDPKIVVRPSNN